MESKCNSLGFRKDQLGSSTSPGGTVSQNVITSLAISAGSALSGGLRFAQLGLMCFIGVVLPTVLYTCSTISQRKDSVFSGWDVDVAAWMLPVSAILLITTIAVLVSWCGTGGSAWGAARLRKLNIAPGPLGFPVVGCALDMQGLAHRKLAKLAKLHHAEKLMAFSVGCTRVVVTSDPDIAAEMLRGQSFQERPLKQAAEMLLFDRAMGFAAPGPYWLRLRRIAATCLFCPRQISANSSARQFEASRMLEAISDAAGISCSRGTNLPVKLRSFLQRAAVNNMTRIVFGKRYEFGASPVAEELEGMIRECFEALGAFNYADHFPGLRFLEMFDVSMKCRNLVPRVKAYVQGIIDEHRSGLVRDHGEVDMVDILLALEGDDRLSDNDMIAVLWEMIFRGTDTVAVTIEWALAEFILNPGWQERIQTELDTVVGCFRMVESCDMDKLPSLQAFITETFRVHPAGPLMSWARLSTRDVSLGGYDVPKGTTCMVNMWSILRNEKFYANPELFDPSRFIRSEGGKPVDVRGGDLRLAPFGSGRRICPGRELALAVVHLWTARLLQNYTWSSPQNPIDLSEDLKLSCEMLHSLEAVPTLRVPLFT
uniref:Cytochrome P450-4 n=1 Tax=Plagiochasma appendiculatum TaxID=157224 RepID=A0A2R3U997_9MARC|nr:cytochrome P450-4 [Plagiochasma appendiculatum]